MDNSLYKEKYGYWAGNPHGYTPDYDNCCKEVFGSFNHYQCSRKRGYGEHKSYCKQHAKMADIFRSK